MADNPYTPPNAAQSVHPTSSRLVDRYRWITYLLPMIVYMLAGSLEPTRSAHGGIFGLEIPYSAYPAAYAAKIALTILAMVVVWAGYRRYPFRVSPLAILVGAVGVVLWIGICRLNLEHRFLAPNGLGWLVGTGERSAFNPLREMADQPGWAYAFLAVRLFGLAIVVPVIEEFFLRGFVIRFAVDGEAWWKVPFGTVTPVAIVIATVLPMMMHPGELFAAAVWFSLVTWLMVRTRNIWDCVVAHAVTNLLLGIYVITTGEWHLM